MARDFACRVSTAIQIQVDNSQLTAGSRCRSHDRAFLDNVAQDIIHQHSQRLDYYKGNFSQFYATKTERSKNLKKEYESQLQYRQHLQVRLGAHRTK
jgi:ATPase subunit of ABC transporter with duplicated ATPase domains